MCPPSRRFGRTLAGLVSSDTCDQIDTYNNTTDANTLVHHTQALTLGLIVTGLICDEVVNSTDPPVATILK